VNLEAEQAGNIRLSPEYRHGSKSRDVGRVSRRGLGRLLARRPALRGSTRCFPIAPQSLSCARHFVLSYSPHFVP